MTSIENRALDSPLFSICIPQYNRTSFLLAELESFRQQTFKNFELCISDDCSNDGRTGDLMQFLEQSGMSYRFRRMEQNGRYDKNLRSAMSLARGRFCLLMGNDDRLISPDVLHLLSGRMAEFDWPEVAITNYQELSTGTEFHRIQKTGMRGAGPWVAASNYRNFAFVSGILLHRELAQQYATDKWDGSEMYQMFIGTKMIAAGGRLLGLTELVVGKDLQLPGDEAEHYWSKPAIKNCPIVERKLPLIQYGRVAFDAIAPFISSTERNFVARQIFKQFYQFTYPPWIVEYRRVQSWRYALGFVLGMRPQNSLKDVPMSLSTRLHLHTLFIFVTVVGLVVPTHLFESLRPRLHTLAKAFK
jgi:glycosyltransferase involved in cell wall biosynthesis